MGGRESGDGPSSLHTRSQGPKGPKTFKWMKKNLQGILHGNKWIVFHGLPDTVLGTSGRGGSNAKLGTVATD